MPARKRTTVSSRREGTRTHVETGTVTSVVSQDTETCDDVTGQGDNQAFNVNRIKRSGSLINGEGAAFGATTRWNNYPSDWSRTDSGSFGHCNLSSVPPALGGLAATLLRRTNPSRSSVDAVVTMAEARELPTLVKDLWKIANDDLLRKVPRRIWRTLGYAARLNLMYEFGIVPLVSDSVKLTSFPGLVDKRVQEIERLRTRGLRRTVELWSGSGNYTGNSTIQSSGLVAGVTVNKVRKQVIRGHVRWYTRDNYVMSDRDKRLEALKILSGASIDCVTAWELMPWSWLIDYFTNIGDFVAVTRNNLAAYHSTPALMVHDVTHTTHRALRFANGITISEYHAQYETKNRRGIAASLQAQNEFLTGTQMSILGNLSIARSIR